VSGAVLRTFNDDTCMHDSQLDREPMGSGLHTLCNNTRWNSRDKRTLEAN